MTNYNNSFERLVTAACEQNFCWNLFCTTCGCMEIRNGLELIGEGLLPEVISRDALINTSVTGGMQAALERDNQLAQELAAANLATLSSLPMPDWLGCLGLALYRFEPPPILFAKASGDETDYSTRRDCWQLIGFSWAKQFRSLLGGCADEELKTLLTRCNEGQRSLRWQDLSVIERALLPAHSENKASAHNHPG